MNNLYQNLFKTVDASSLAVFRMGFGAILLFDCINYGIFLCLECDYHHTNMLFKYAGFEWIKPLPTLGLRALWLLMGVCAAGIMLGWHYRVCMIAFTLGFIYQFLLDQAVYLNHFYMVILFCILMCFIPANRYWALDARRNKATHGTSGGYKVFDNQPSLMPNWPRFLLAAQLEIILIYAGLVKINYDWLNLEPLRMWLTRRSADEGPILQLLTQDWGIAVASYGSILLHLVGAPLLLYRPARLYVLAAYAAFHISNAFVFNIGIFPWFTLFGSLILFDPDWPKQLWNGMRWRFQAIRDRYPQPPLRIIGSSFSAPTTKVHHVIVIMIAGWLLLQVLIPVRHLVMPGDVAWNEAGHRYSWRMKLRSKQGKARFAVSAQNDNGNLRWIINPVDHLNQRQARKMPCIPDMVWQFAQYLEQHYTELGHKNVKVQADIVCSLNGRKYSRFINPQVDLTKISRYEPTSSWIVPLDKPLPNPVVSKLMLGLISK